MLISLKKTASSPFDMACQRRHDNIEEVLIKGGAVNLCDSKGFSPLAAASNNGHESTMQLLIENGANVNLFEKKPHQVLFIWPVNADIKTL